MIDFEFAPPNYFDGTGPSALVAKLAYPESQWGDEIGIYATPLDGEIYYEAVDFYGNDYSLTPEKSAKPLTLQEIIFMIETIDVSLVGEQEKIQITLRGIPNVESLVYPQLQEYFTEKRKNFGLL
jgi:hypothetical protein